SVSHPALSPDGKQLYFASDMPGGQGKSDLYRINLHANGSYGSPENLGPEINTDGDGLFPFVSSDNTLFFSSDGHPGEGLLDIYSALADEEGHFIGIRHLPPPINSKRDDFSFYMDHEGLSGYLASNRGNKVDNDDIYTFNTILPLLLKGQVTDRINGAAIAEATVTLRDVRGSTLMEI